MLYARHPLRYGQHWKWREKKRKYGRISDYVDDVNDKVHYYVCVFVCLCVRVCSLLSITFCRYLKENNRFAIILVFLFFIQMAF